MCRDLDSSDVREAGESLGVGRPGIDGSKSYLVTPTVLSYPAQMYGQRDLCSTPAGGREPVLPLCSEEQLNPLSWSESFDALATLYNHGEHLHFRLHSVPRPGGTEMAVLREPRQGKVRRRISSCFTSRDFRCNRFVLEIKNMSETTTGMELDHSKGSIYRVPKRFTYIIFANACDYPQNPCRARRVGRGEGVTNVRGGDERCIGPKMRSHGGQDFWWEAVSP